MSLDLAGLVRRKIADLGNDGAAAYFGVTDRTIKNWKSGRFNPPVEKVQKVYDETHVGVKPDEITEADWGGSKCVILMPSRGDIRPETMFCLMALFDKYHKVPDGEDEKGNMRWRRRLGFDMEVATMVMQARNLLATRFLKTDAEWSLWIDDDMIVPCGKPGAMTGRFGAKMDSKYLEHDVIGRLMKTAEKAQATIVSGLYFGRHSGGRGMFADALANDAANHDCHNVPRDQAKRTDWAATGCLLVHRRVYEDILEKFPDVASGAQYRDSGGNKSTVYGFFTTYATAQGEDKAFGLRAKEAGHDTWVDFGCVCGHIGHRAYWQHNTG